jgi:hypothetical protein
MNFIDTKTKRRHLKNWPVKGLCGRYLSEIIDWRYSQSCRYFWPSFVNCCPSNVSLVHCCPSNLLSGAPPPPPGPSLCQSTVYTDSVLLAGGGGCWVLLKTIFCRSLTFCIWPDSEPSKFLDHPEQKPKSGGVFRQINTCRKVPTRQFFRRVSHFALVSV